MFKTLWKTNKKLDFKPKIMYTNDGNGLKIVLKSHRQTGIY